MDTHGRVKKAVDALGAWDKMQRAFAFIEEDSTNTLNEQIEICQVPAPSYQEKERGRLYADKFRELNLEDVHTDEVGNVFGTVRGSDSSRRLIVAAHLDTVFPVDTDVTVKREGTVLQAPGIGDDTRGLAEILSIVRAINETGMKPVCDIVFCGNVCEEGQGDLRGVRHIFSTMSNICGFITIDGARPGTVLYTATGSHRYRISYKGRGGHSLHDFGMPNPIHALGRAIAGIADIQVPDEPVTTFSVGVVEGGTSINSIPYEATMYVDMRSNSAHELSRLEDSVVACANSALEAENGRWSQGDKLSLTMEMIGNRPAGQLPADSVIVMTALEVLKHLGIEPVVNMVGSTDANIPISIGVPAINTGSGGKGGNTHNLAEWYDVKDSHIGPQKTLMLIMALAGAEGVSEALL